MPYFVIHNSEGDTAIEQISKEELLNRIGSDNAKRDYYGDVGFLSEIKEADTNYWENNILIIKGKIITPKAIKVVEKYEV